LMAKPVSVGGQSSRCARSAISPGCHLRLLGLGSNRSIYGFEESPERTTILRHDFRAEFFGPFAEFESAFEEAMPAEREKIREALKRSIER